MIFGSTPVEAVGVLRGLLQQAIACISTAVLSERPPSPTRTLFLAHPISSPHGRVTVRIQHAFVVIHDQSRATRERWEARTAGYMYKLDGADGREILAYHWHPAGRSHKQRPHLHIGAGFGAIQPAWQKAHFRTGFVTPGPMLALLIDHSGRRGTAS